MSRPVFAGLVMQEVQNLAGISSLLAVDCGAYIAQVIDTLCDLVIKDYPKLNIKVIYIRV